MYLCMCVRVYYCTTRLLHLHQKRTSLLYNRMRWAVYTYIAWWWIYFTCQLDTHTHHGYAYISCDLNTCTYRNGVAHSRSCLKLFVLRSISDAAARLSFIICFSYFFLSWVRRRRGGSIFFRYWFLLFWPTSPNSFQLFVRDIAA